MSCSCGSNWIVEVCDLASGQVRRVLHPLSMTWQTQLNASSTGSLTFATRDLAVRDIWPGLTSVYISRVTGPDASDETPVCEFAGYISEIQATDDNTTQVGMESIDKYLWRRTIKETVRWTDIPQTVIGQELVQLAAPNGIPLYAEADATQQVRDRQYDHWEYKVIGEAVEQLTNVINGPDWEMRHDRVDGHWSSTMIFRDWVGEDRGVELRSDIELSAYSITIGMEDMATWVDAVGEGEEEDQVHVTAVDPSGIYPEFDAVPAWVDVSRVTTLQSHADGYLQQNREPDARPAVTISGLDPLNIRNGDTVGIHTDFGPITYHGKARVFSISWGLDTDSPEQRTLEVVPLDRASQTILNQEPSDVCGSCR